jgi:hypothetical protein
VLVDIETHDWELYHIDQDYSECHNLAGDAQAYIAGILFVLAGAALVFFLFPKRDEERDLLTAYYQKDMADIVATTSPEAISAACRLGRRKDEEMTAATQQKKPGRNFPFMEGILCRLSWQR